MLIREAKSWGPKSGRGVLDEGGETEICELDRDTELESDGA